MFLRPKVTTREKVAVLCQVLGYQAHFGNEFHLWAVVIVTPGPMDIPDHSRGRGLLTPPSYHHQYRTLDAALAALQQLQTK